MKNILLLIVVSIAFGVSGYLIGRKSGLVVAETSCVVLGEAKEYQGFADQYYYVYQYLPVERSERMRSRVKERYITAKKLYDALPENAPMQKSIASYFQGHGSLDWLEIDKRLPKLENLIRE